LNRASLAVLATLVALAAIVAGCGGSDDSDTGGTSSSSLTKAQFVKQADTICEKSEEKLGSEFESYVKEKGWSEDKEPSKEQQEEAVVEVVTPNLQGQIDDIRDLGAPEGDEDQIETMLSTVEEGIEDLEDDPSQLTEQGSNPLAKGSKLATAYGLEKCGAE
jgi:hypothetical protein